MKETEYHRTFEASLKYKSFLNSIECIALSSSEYSTMVRKTSDLQCSDYCKMHMWNSSPFGMIWSLVPHGHVKQPPPHKFAQKAFWKKSLHILGKKDTMKKLHHR